MLGGFKGWVGPPLWLVQVHPLCRTRRGPNRHGALREGLEHQEGGRCGTLSRRLLLLLMVANSTSLRSSSLLSLVSLNRITCLMRGGFNLAENPISAPMHLDFIFNVSAWLFVFTIECLLIVPIRMSRRGRRSRVTHPYSKSQFKNPFPRSPQGPG